MSLTNEIVLSMGFKLVNNSMFRLNGIVLQNTHIPKQPIGTEKGYKIWVKGEFLGNIKNKKELEFMLLYFN